METAINTATAKDYKWTGFVFIAMFGLFMIGYFILMGAFEFPDILRADSAVRFTLFDQNRATIVPAYYLVGFTSVIQIVMAVMWYHLTRSGRLVDIMTLIMGLLCGIFQILGFYRWVAAIPMLSNAYQASEVSNETIFFMEKFANTYFGMTVGEHLGNFFLALWLFGVAIVMMRQTAFDRKLKVIAWISAIAMFVNAYEPFGGVHETFAPLAPLAAPLWGVYFTWMLLIGISMITTREKTVAPKIPVWIWGIAIVFFVGNVVPAFMG